MKIISEKILSNQCNKTLFILYILFFSINVILSYSYNFVNIYFQKNLGQIAHNVPAENDGMTARIEKCVAFLGLANCG
jgi:hypothetical protein